MARIRSVKPEFFRHEGLQDLEVAHPGKYPMLVFEGLWCHCDSKGRFEWRPRQLKLDILPFLPFDMTATLAILEESGMAVGDDVDIVVSENEITIRKKVGKKFSLEDLVSRMPRDYAGGEESFGPPIGKEEW